MIGSVYIPRGERILIDLKPHPVSIVLRALATLALLAIASVAASYAGRRIGWAHADVAFLAAVGLAALRVAWEFAAWLGRRYILTERRLLAIHGVFSRHAIDIPLDSIRHVSLSRSLAERLLGVGSLGFDTAGTAFTEAWWLMIDKPAATLERVRAALATPTPLAPTPAPRVLGLAGGIGSGKSSAAAALARRGWLVSDSDRAAQEALDRSDVRAALVSWWGSEVLDPAGRVDRKRVADIVFADPGQRRRLEALVHPLLRAGRAELIARAREVGAQGVVIDAPLLFEAGLDAECDAVLFIDAPENARRERIRARGWDESEWRRRESAQLPLDQKRRRATVVIPNDSGHEQLDARIGAFLKSQEFLKSGAGPAEIDRIATPLAARPNQG